MKANSICKIWKHNYIEIRFNIDNIDNIQLFYE